MIDEFESTATQLVSKVVNDIVEKNPFVRGVIVDSIIKLLKIQESQMMQEMFGVLEDLYHRVYSVYINVMEDAMVVIQHFQQYENELLSIAKNVLNELGRESKCWDYNFKVPRTSSQTKYVIRIFNGYHFLQIKGRINYTLLNLQLILICFITK